MAGLLLLLIATPVACVAFSIIVFIIERDRLYVAIIAAPIANPNSRMTNTAAT